MGLKRRYITDLARELRRNQTQAEKLFWSMVRGRSFEGLKFQRQKPIVYEQFNGIRYFYIADFYCAEYRLIVEIDGKVHDGQQEDDEARSIVLRRLNYRVIRIKNEEFSNPDQVMQKIRNYIVEL